MAKPKQKKTESPALKGAVSSQISKNVFAFLPLGSGRIFLPLVLAITFLCLSPSLQDKFTNLDDTQYLIENPVVKDFNSENLKTIFSEQFVGNYQPITMLIYMI